MSAFQSSIVYSLVLAVVGYVIMSVTGITLPLPAVFAIGLFIGALFITFINNSSSSTSTTASTSTAPSTAKSESVDDSKGGPTKTIYVGNLPYRANEAIIKELFEKFGYVHSVRLLKDRQTGKRRGFGFVEMDEPAAMTAISELNESDFQQRTLKVREAKDRPEREETNEFQEQS